VLHSREAVSAAVRIVRIRGYCPQVSVGWIRLSFAPRGGIALTRNRSCAEESIVDFSLAPLLDFSPRTEALQVWWIRLFETGGFANQIARRP
jgi:hypothetical protein